MAPICRYANSGELNYRIAEKERAIDAVLKAAQAWSAGATRSDIDGIRLDDADGWLSVRKSNTEPYLRLIVETRDAALLRQRLAALEAALAPFVDTSV